MVVLDFDGHPQKYDQLEVAISLNTSAKFFVLQRMSVSRFSLSPLVISNGIPAAEWKKERSFVTSWRRRRALANLFAHQKMSAFAVTRGERLES